jgi:hypothetical protein
MGRRYDAGRVVVRNNFPAWPGFILPPMLVSSSSSRLGAWLLVTCEEGLSQSDEI